MNINIIIKPILTLRRCEKCMNPAEYFIRVEYLDPTDKLYGGFAVEARCCGIHKDAIRRLALSSKDGAKAPSIPKDAICEECNRPINAHNMADIFVCSAIRQKRNEAEY